MATIAEIRQSHPEYNDMSDQQLADSLHKKFYSDMPIDKFYLKVGVNVAQPEQPTQDQSFMNRVGEDINARRQQVRDIGARNLNPINEAGQIAAVGQGVISDVIGQAANSIGSTYRSAQDAIFPSADSVAGQVIRQSDPTRIIGEGMDRLANSEWAKKSAQSYANFAQRNPNTATYLEGAGNLLNNVGMVDGAGIVGKATVDVAKKAPAALVKSGEASLAKQAVRDTAANRDMRYKILVDDTSKAGKEAISENSNLTSKIKNIKYSESATDKKMLDATADLPLKPSNPITMNKTIVKEANDKLRSDIGAYLEKNAQNVNPVDVRVAIKDAKSSVDKVGYIGADENSKAVSSVFEKAQELTKNVKNSNDLFKARQAFDNWAKAQKNENKLFGDGLDNSVKESVNQIRRNMNDLIEKSIPDSQYKELMRKHSGLIEAEQVLTKKAVGEATTAVGRYMNKAKEAVDRLGIPLSVASAAGLTGLLAVAPQLAVGGAVGYGAYKGGKAVAKAAQKAVAKASVKVGKALSPAEKAIAAKPSIPTGGKQLLLEGPKKSASQTPMTAQEIKAAQAKNRVAPSNTNISGSAIRPAAKPDQVPPKLLTGPKPDIKVSPSGKATSQSGAEMTAAYEQRKALNDIGMTGDVRRLISQKEMRDTVGKDWDKLNKAQQDLVQKQVNAAWSKNKVPIEKIIEAAKIDAIRLSSAKNEVSKSNALSEALLNAKPLKNKPKSGSIPNNKNPLTEK